MLNKQLIFSISEGEGDLPGSFLRRPIVTSLALLQTPECCKMQRENFAPDQLTFLGLTGLEVLNYCRGCRYQRDGRAMRQRLAGRGQREQTKPVLPVPTPESGGLHMLSGLCPAEKPSSININWG